jgi:hypothetical protein
MATVFSSLVLPAWSSTKPATKPSPPEAILEQDFNPSERQPVQEEPDLRDVNNALRALIDIFPDVQPEVFREMLSRVSENSRLEIVAEQLLKNDAKWIRGRFRRVPKTPSKDEGKKKPAKEDQLFDAQLRQEDVFRNEAYKTAVKIALYDEFKGLSHSAIKAVLAEHNYHYTSSRAELISIVSKSWRFSFTSFFTRRKAPSASKHPFLEWPQQTDKSAPDKRPAIPKLLHSRNYELNQELYDTLIVPILAKQKEAQEIVDHAIAHQIREQESTEAEEIYDCDCCYSSVTVHNMAACDDGCHYICFRCISHTVNEAIYGQGWTTSIDAERATIRCVAPALGMDEDCHGCIPFEMVARAVTEKETGTQTLQKLESRIASESLQKSKLTMVHCPFCSYAEIDDLAMRQSHHWKFRRSISLTFITIWTAYTLNYLNMLAPIILLGLTLYLTSYYLPTPFTHSLSRLTLKSRGLRFTCRSPTCLKKSCMRCHTLWRDPHECYSSQLTSLQQTLESAMTSAIKRTCPKCNVSFVKSAGCNKLVCVCGYQMCYLCRADISTNGYQHFCQHFRPMGGQCKDCDSCDLYRMEDDKTVVEEARKRAEKEWWEGEGRGVSKTLVREKITLGAGTWRELGNWRAWEGWLDGVVERVCIVVDEE